MKRERENTVFRHKNIPVCKKTFCFIHAINTSPLENIQSNFYQKTQSHGNKNRVSHNATEMMQLENFKIYIYNHTNTHRLGLPGRVTSQRNNDNRVLVLPTFHSKAFYRQYVKDLRI